MIWVRWCLLKSIMSFMTNQVKNGISLITIPVPIVCVFQGSVVSCCWYFAQVLLRILITAPLALYLLFLCALWSSGDRCRRHVFYFSNRAALGRNLHFFGGRMGREWDREGGGDHLTFRRTEGVIIRNWEPKEELEELNSERRLKSVGQCQFQSI